jgi:predicted nucleic acid-binding protein
VEQHPRYASAVGAALAQQGGEPFSISPLTKLECLVAPMRDANLVLQRHYEELFENLMVLPLDEPVWRLATELRARYGLKTPDALHLACAQHHACKSLWTNDERLAQAARGFAVNVLKTAGQRTRRP